MAKLGSKKKDCKFFEELFSARVARSVSLQVVVNKRVIWIMKQNPNVKLQQTITSSAPSLSI